EVVGAFRESVRSDMGHGGGEPGIAARDVRFASRMTGCSGGRLRLGIARPRLRTTREEVLQPETRGLIEDALRDEDLGHRPIRVAGPGLEAGEELRRIDQPV